MRLTDDDVQAFSAIWKEEFGEELCPDDARQRASEIAELYGILAGIPIESARSQDPTHP